MTEKNNRTALRPAQAATYLDCSTASLWRWAKTLEGFPQPHRLPGQRVTIWFQDELEAWMAKQGDIAWRCNAPAAGVPLFHADDLDAGRRALWCAYLLDLSPFEVFPLGPASDPAGTQHLFEYLLRRVDQLRAEAPEPNPANADLTGYLRTLAHCGDVLTGRGMPEIRGQRGFENAGKYRRGIYVQGEGRGNGNA